jgi:hypothetical protein
MTETPVHLDVRSPLRFDRVQLLLRLALALALGWVGITAGWLACLLYLALPVIAALAISSGDAERFHRDFAPRLWRVLRWLVQFSAYMMLLVDRFPTGDDDLVHVDVRYTGRPTLGAALARLVTTIPSALVLGVLGCVSGVLWLIAALLVLLDSPMPSWLLGFQRGTLRWMVRALAYHAALVDQYPPFSFDPSSDDGSGAPLAASGAS